MKALPAIERLPARPIVFGQRTGEVNFKSTEPSASGGYPNNRNAGSFYRGKPWFSQA
jgi:hypothetical protein